MADLSQATIKHGKKWVKFQAKCLEHGIEGTFTSATQPDFNNEKFWAFRCKAAGGHIFLAVMPEGWPDDTADQMYYLNRIQKRELVLPGLQ